MVSNKENAIEMNQHGDNSVQIGEVSAGGGVTINYYGTPTSKHASPIDRERLKMSELKILLPPRLKQKLSGTSWEVFVGTTAINAEPFLKGEPRFFPEYTIHGIDHINHIIEIADRLIPDALLSNDDLLSAEDIGILLCSMIIHDLGMFLDVSKFSMLATDEDKKVIGFQPDESYSVLWKDYCKKAKLNSQDKWMNLIGKPQHELPVIKDPGEWTERDRMVIGEFLRWYHHRFAHEIALFGFMETEMLPHQLTQRHKSVIGLVARSHGMDIRSFEIEEFCKNQFGNADYVDNCPVYYLMSLLRLSDYLDTGLERAPKALSDVHTFLSETSRKEWALNQNFRFGSFGWRNAETTRTLDMPATPKTTSEFVRAEKLVIDIQREFDSSVALIEELYHGRYRLTINRVTSNILKPSSRATFAQRFSLYDTRLSASSDILPLLVSPLYSNNPTFGVRELIQNAVDACLERATIDAEYKGLIKVEVDTRSNTFTITDDGIGMSEDTVRNYYLRAGSSYRNSDSWNSKFTDSSGKTTLTRSGRFGIGALATFLIGENISIFTRHLDDDAGLNFTYTLNADNPIDVVRDSSVKAGTTIIITMSEYVRNYFSDADNVEKWNRWYCHEEPEIQFILDGNEISNKYLLPSNYSENEGWFNFPSEIYNHFLWSYRCIHPTTHVGVSSELICNGIPIAAVEFPYHQYNDQWKNMHWSILRGYGFDMHLPLISIIDNDGRLKLDLSRRQIEEFPLEDDFIKEMYKYLIAELLAGSYFAQSDNPRGYTNWESKHGYIPIAHSDRGYTILARSFVLHTGEDLWCYIGGRQPIDTKIPLGYMFVFDASSDVDSIHYNTNSSLNGRAFINGDLLIDRSYFTKCCGGIVMKSSANALKSTPNVLSLMPMFAPDSETMISTTNSTESGLVSLSNIYNHDSFKDIYMSKSDYINENDLDIEKMLDLACQLQDDNTMFLQYIPTPLRDNEKNLMLEILREYLPSERNGGWIPHDMEERKKMYPEAFSELKNYIDSLAETEEYVL